MNLEHLGKVKANTAHFDSILKFVAQVQGATLAKNAGVGAHVVTLDELREDIVKPSLPIELVLANAKRHDGRYFVVPQVVE